MTAEPKSGSGFFHIDKRTWAKVAAVGMNEAAAYVVQACGTGPDNKGTCWSTEAVKKYAGIGWARARPAIEGLLAGGFIRLAGNHTVANPRYELATYRDLLNYQFARHPSSSPDYIDENLIWDLLEGTQPASKSGRRRAERLIESGRVRKDASGIYTPVTIDSSANLIWLPNAVVTGTSKGEQSPVRRLRSAGCVWALRLFVDLYTAQNLRDDGGISPNLIRQKFIRTDVGQQGPLRFGDFKDDVSIHWWAGPFAEHRNRERPKSEDYSPAWRSINLLKEMGLLSFVPHIFENDTDAAEPVHPYDIGGRAEAPMEHQIGDAAEAAARAMALPSEVDKAVAKRFQHFCPVLRTMPNVQMIGVARLTYRPHTRRTTAWAADLHQNGPGWLQTFNDLAARAEEASFHRAANRA